MSQLSTPAAEVWAAAVRRAIRRLSRPHVWRAAEETLAVVEEYVSVTVVSAMRVLEFVYAGGNVLICSQTQERNSHTGTPTAPRRFVLEAPTRSFLKRGASFQPVASRFRLSSPETSPQGRRNLLILRGGVFLWSVSLGRLGSGVFAV